jgi:hypothetical protein
MVRNMKLPERTEETIEQLANTVAEEMDYDDMISYVYDSLVTMYEMNLDLFNEDWENHFGENND